jgi:hypothetical protein
LVGTVMQASAEGSRGAFDSFVMHSLVLVAREECQSIQGLLCLVG